MDYYFSNGLKTPSFDDSVRYLLESGSKPNRTKKKELRESMCAMVKSRYTGDGHPTFNRNPYNGYINPYYWVDDHPLLYGNNGSLDPGTCNSLV